MKLIFSSTNSAEIGLLRTLLEQDGIACTTRNERLSLALGEVPFLECTPELWIVHDEDLSRAQILINRWKDKASQQFAAWQCPACGEENEGQFGACWKCGHQLEEAN